MTKEESERRQTHESNRSEPISNIVTRSRGNSNNQQLGIGTAASSGMDGATSERQRHLDREKSPPGSPVAVERTMQKAQKQVNKETNTEKGRRRSEEEKPSRTLLTTEQSDRVLPIVSEESMTDVRNGGDGTIDVDVAKERVSGIKRGEAIRMVSASTKRDSGEENERERERRSEETNGDVDEKSFEPRRGREKPPRLDSGLIPSVSPIDETTRWESMDGDPEKR